MKKLTICALIALLIGWHAQVLAAYEKTLTIAAINICDAKWSENNITYGPQQEIGFPLSGKPDATAFWLNAAGWSGLAYVLENTLPDHWLTDVFFDSWIMTLQLNMDENIEGGIRDHGPVVIGYNFRW